MTTLPLLMGHSRQFLPKATYRELLLSLSLSLMHTHTSAVKNPNLPGITNTSALTTIQCINCVSPTAYLPPPTWSDTSPPPVYRPIRAPPINLPPHSNPQQSIMLTTVPQSQTVPTVSPPFQFQSPSKSIHSENDIIRFRKFET